jgi:hypothetical protein
MCNYDYELQILVLTSVDMLGKLGVNKALVTVSRLGAPHVS